MTSTKKFCERMERLRVEATPGPWEWYAEDASTISLNTVGDPLEGHVLSSALCKSCHDHYGKVDGKVAPFKEAHCLMPSRANRDHIVAMHNAQEAMIRVIRAASTVIGIDSNHGLALEPEVADAMDSLAVALDALDQEDTNA